MPKYRYTAQDAQGKKKKGVMNAADETALFHSLQESGLYLLDSKEMHTENRTKRIKARDLAEFSRQIGTLLQAGVSLVRALSIVCEEEAIKPVHKAIYQNVLRSIRQGTTLSDAMEEQGEAFSPLLIEMYRSAEASGTLDKTALRMATHYDKEYRTNSKVKGAMTYPAILSGLIVVVVAIIFTFVIPQFEDMFSQMESLPIATTILFAISYFIQARWRELLVVIGIIMIAVYFILRIPRVRLAMDRMKVHMPVFGKLLRTIYTARFARSLSSLYSAGLPIVTALQIGRKIVGNAYIDSQFDSAIAHVRTGGNLSEALRMIDGFTNKLSSSIAIGEETGSLDSMLDATADSLDYESEMAINRMITMMEPILIVVMAVIVGFIVIAVITPIYDSYGVVEGSGY